jgi:tetratricopeptide (TPR) repeat protein
MGSELAEAHYRQALALAEELGMRPLVAHCHLGLGKLYARIGRRAETRAALSAAVNLSPCGRTLTLSPHRPWCRHYIPGTQSWA